MEDTKLRGKDLVRHQQGPAGRDPQRYEMSILRAAVLAEAEADLCGKQGIVDALIVKRKKGREEQLTCIHAWTREGKFQSDTHIET